MLYNLLYVRCDNCVLKLEIFSLIACHLNGCVIIQPSLSLIISIVLFESGVCMPILFNVDRVSNKSPSNLSFFSSSSLNENKLFQKAPHLLQVVSSFYFSYL